VPSIGRAGLCEREWRRQSEPAPNDAFMVMNVSSRLYGPDVNLKRVSRDESTRRTIEGRAMLRASTIIIALLWAGVAAADVRPTPADALFCPSWAEAHERTLASLNNGRPPYKVRWKGCIRLKKGEKVDVVDVDKTDGANEIIYKGKHWFTDGGPF
jgi:hypothetical protein